MTAGNGARPVALTVEPERIPEALKVGRRHVVWRYVMRGRWTKPPYTPGSGAPASVTAPSTWRRFDDAVAAYTAGGWDGIGVAQR